MDVEKRFSIYFFDAQDLRGICKNKRRMESKTEILNSFYTLKWTIHIEIHKHV